MGISNIMQPRTSASTEDNCPPSVVPEAPNSPVVSRDVVPAADSPVPTRKVRKSKPKPITDKRLRRTIGLILALRVSGKSRREIAEQLELSENTVQSYLYRAKKRGYLSADSFDNPNDIIETIIKPKVVENITALLDWKNPKTNLPSMDMTIETAKGIGVFQQHSVNKGVQGPVHNANVLKVQILMPPQAAMGTNEARIGTMGGRQAVEAEVIETSED